MRNFSFLLLTSLLLASTSGQAQSLTNECGTGDAPAEVRAYIQSLDYSIDQTEDYPVINIPVTIHIVRSSAGAGGFLESSAYATICDLNNRMASSGMFFYVPAQVQFINEDDYYSANNYGPLFDMIDIHNVPRTMNVYYTNLANMSLCGFAFYPNSGPGGFQNNGAVVMSFACSQPNGTTLTHEVGHFFSLPHTFDRTSTNPTGNNAELVTRNTNEPFPRLSANCNTAGDGFCDTPADFIGSRWSCPTSLQQLDLNGDTFDPDSSYYMSYSSDVCMSRFSTQQILAMRGTLASLSASRGYLLTTPMPNYPVLNTGPATLYPSTSDTVVPETLVFRWMSIPGATLYRIRAYVLNFKVIDTLTADTSYAVYGRTIRPNREHSWEVQALNPAELCAPFSPRVTFRSGAANTASSVLDETSTAIKVYPNFNRTGGTLTIAGLQNQVQGQLYIINTQGQRVYQISLTGADEKMDLELPPLAEGLYYVLINFPNQQFREKLIIQN
jgi:hypothetical protein